MSEVTPPYSEILTSPQIKYTPEPLPLERSGDISWYLMDLFTGDKNLKTGEDIDIFRYAGQEIEKYLASLGIHIQDIEKIGQMHSWYIVIYTNNGDKHVFNLKNIQRNFNPQLDSQYATNGALEGGEIKVGVCYNIYEGSDIPELFRENNEKYHLAWGNFQDHLNAMDAIFDANAEEGFFSGNGFLDNEDTFDANSIMRSKIVNPDLLKKFDGKDIHEIQQLAREEYRKLIAMMNEYPLDMLPPDTQFAISQSMDTYSRMIMGVGDRYEGGARLFDKSRSEVEYGIFLSIKHLGSPTEILHHWLEIRKQINANNFQDTTVEQRAYPFYIKTLNRACYQKMLDLGASKEELLAFARAISGRDSITGKNEWSYGPDHYESEFANVILGNLIGMPNPKKTSSDNEDEDTDREKKSEKSIIDTLLDEKIMQNIHDEKVPNSANLSLLQVKAKSVLIRAGLAFPQYLNNNFFGGREISKVLTGSYSELSLGDKLAVSSVSRFIDYLEKSIAKDESEKGYTQRLRENARNISQTYGSPSGMGVKSESILYEEGSDFFTVGAKHPYGDTIYIRVPIEDIQNPEAAAYYMTALKSLVIQNDIISSNSPGVYTQDTKRTQRDNPKTYGHEELFKLITPFQYGTSEENIMQVQSAASLSSEYIENLKNTSITESIDSISDTIMSRFDGDGNGTKGRIEPQELDSKIFSQTDKNILELWTDINGLGEWLEWSDSRVDMAKTGVKIGLIIALSVAATTLTAGVAAGGLTLAGARGIQVAGTIQRANFLRYSIQRTQILNATRGGSMIYGGIMGAYAAPVSWVVYPHGYSSKEEMIIDLLSDLTVSTGTGVLGGALTPGLLPSIADFTVLGLMTEALRMGIIQEIYHPGENFLDDTEI